ncbi:MAG: hypothetical protein HOO98_20105 [Nitrospira sp.]|nr:hypothetical protein [Nitrospira sp.]
MHVRLKPTSWRRADQAWVAEFLRHKLRLMRMSRTPDQETSPFGDRVPEKTWRETRRILRRMVAMNTARERTGRESIADK